MKLKKLFSMKKSFSDKIVPKIVSMGVLRKGMKSENLKIKRVFFNEKLFTHEIILIEYTLLYKYT